MAAVGAPDRSNVRRMPRRLQPVVDSGTDFSALNRRFSRRCVAGDEQNQPLISGDRTFQSAIDRAPCPVEIQPVQVDGPVGLQRAGAQALVPAGIQRRSGKGLGRSSRHGALANGPGQPTGCDGRGFRARIRRAFNRLAGKRADRCRDLLPKRLFFSAEGTHCRTARALSVRSVSAAGRVLVLSPPSRRRRDGHNRPRPNRYRPGWRP